MVFKERPKTAVRVKCLFMALTAGRAALRPRVSNHAPLTTNAIDHPGHRTPAVLRRLNTANANQITFNLSALGTIRILGLGNVRNH